MAGPYFEQDEALGEMRDVMMIAEPMFDPKSERMRG